MEKPGQFNMHMGIFWAICGLALTYVSFAIFQWEAGVIFYGAVVAGVIQFFWGIIQRAQYAFMTPEQKETKHLEATVITLIRSIALVANADGVVSDEEKELISAIYERVLGSPPDNEQLNKTISNINESGTDAWELIASKGGQIPYSQRLLIIKSCYLVMGADGEISEDEIGMLKQIAEGLSLNEQDVNNAVAELSD